MSADNWAYCPQCTERCEASFRQREAAIAASYGTVPVEKFDADRAKLDADKRAFDTRTPTFREDYEIYGAETGEITVTYSGHCTECACGLDFDDVRSIPGGV